MRSIKIDWDGETYTINDKEAFEIGEIVEEIIPLTELGAMQAHPRFHKLARCYAAMINFAGGMVTPKEVHTSMMAQMKDDDNAGVVIATTAISAIVEILMDGAPASDEGDGKKPVEVKPPS